MNKSLLNKFKPKFISIDWKTIVNLVFWILFTLALIAFTLMFIIERNTVYAQKHELVPAALAGCQSINDIKTAISKGNITSGSDLAIAYTTMQTWAVLPLIDFSLMLFLNKNFSIAPANPADGWSIRSNQIDVAYSYMFITALIAIIALIIQLYVAIRMIRQNAIDKKLNLSLTFPTSSLNYRIFHIKMYMDFIVNLTIVFAFFNFISTLIVVGYWLLSWLMNLIVKKALKKDHIINDTWSSNKSDFLYLIFVMIFQTTYTILKSVFISKWGVNLDLIFQIILPIGTITIIIGLFIKNMLSSKVNSINKAIKSVEGNIKTFRTFYYVNGIDAINDFNFVEILPPMIKNRLTDTKVSKTQINELMQRLDTSIKFIEQHYSFDQKEKQFALYTIFTNTIKEEQLKEIENNALKIETYHTSKHRHG